MTMDRPRGLREADLQAPERGMRGSSAGLRRQVALVYRRRFCTTTDQLANKSQTRRNVAILLHLLLAFGSIVWASLANYLPLAIPLYCLAAFQFAAALVALAQKRWPLAFTIALKNKGQSFAYPVLVITRVDTPVRIVGLQIAPPDDEGLQAIDN